MKPVLGWTMLSWEEMRQVERALSSGEQGTRDEIGFLLIHQGFADRFFPGTSVLHTRVRYALVVPWLYLRAAHNRLRGVDLDTMIRRLLIELAIRLKQIGGEPYGRVRARRQNGYLLSCRNPGKHCGLISLANCDGSIASLWGNRINKISSRRFPGSRMTAGTSLRCGRRRLHELPVT